VDLHSIDKTSAEWASSLLTDLTQMDKDWLIPRFCGVFENKKITPDLYLMYSFCLPMIVPLFQEPEFYSWKNVSLLETEPVSELEKHLLYRMGGT
jgi:hypothetical protein